MDRETDMNLEALRQAMEQASDRGDFEEAAALRDRISILRGTSVGNIPSDFDVSGLSRQRPGAMGLGTSRQRLTPPADWTPPIKPDPMTRGRSRRARNRR